MPQALKPTLVLDRLTDEQLVRLRASLEAEMRHRGIAFSVGEIGEHLIIDHFKNTRGLPKLQRAPRGTKNVDALSRNGDRYSIKTLWNAKKTGTVYPDSEEQDKQLFEFLVIAHLTDDLGLKSIHRLAWKDFLDVRSWDKRMSAWYVSCSAKSLDRAELIYAARISEQAGALERSTSSDAQIPRSGGV